MKITFNRIFVRTCQQKHIATSKLRKPFKQLLHDNDAILK